MTQNSYTSDISLYYQEVRCKEILLLQTEVAFSQSWEELVDKVKLILQDPGIWGVFALKVGEASKWGSPRRSATLHDFISICDWDAWASSMQQEMPFSTISVQGIEWTKDITVSLRFFPSSWAREDDVLPMVCTN